MRAGFRLLRTQAFRPRERKQAEPLNLAQVPSCGLRNQIKKAMRGA